MQKLPLLMLSVIGACAALYACSSSSGDDDDGIIPYDAGPDVVFVADTGVDGPAAAAGMGKAFCDATLGVIQNDIGQCCAPAEKTGLASDLYKNIDTYLTACETTLENSIAQHRTAPSSAEYTACENAYKAEFVLPGAGANACQGLDAYRPGDVLSISCAGAFVGTGAVSSPCSGNFDCGNGLTCVGYAAGTDGTCQALVPADGTCGPATSTTAPAVDFVLQPANSCVSDFYCNGGTCKAQLAQGTSCTSDEQCTGGACFTTLCATANADGTRLPTGAYCAASADCIEGDYCRQEPDCGSEPCVPKADGGAPAEATGACEPSLGGPDAGAQACDSANAHECQGACISGSCGQLCTWH